MWEIDDVRVDREIFLFSLLFEKFVDDWIDSPSWSLKKDRFGLKIIALKFYLPSSSLFQKIHVWLIFFVRWSLEKEIWLKIFQSSFLSSSSWKFLDDYSLLKEWLEKKIIVQWYKIDHHFAKIIHLVKRSSFDMFVDIGTVNQRKNKFLLSELSWISLSRLLRLEHYTVSFIGIFRSYEARNQCEHVGWPSIIILVFWPKIHILLPFCDNMTLYMTR